MTLTVANLIDAQITLPASLSLTEESKATRSILLADSDFKAIATREDANAVGSSARDIRTHIKAVREMGMNLRRPLKAAQDQIKAIEDEYCGPLEQRQGQLENLVTAYAKAEAQRVADEERKRQEEVRRIAIEEAAAIATVKAQQDRIEREQREADEKLKAAAQSQTLTASELFKAGMEAEKRRVEAEEATAKAEADIEAARQASLEALSATVAAPIEAHKIAGVATKRVCKWSVIDEKLLFSKRPELFKVELKKSAVNSTCFPRGDKFTTDNPDTESVPGLHLWWENEAVTRAY
jgi:hypothetical protein